MGRIEQKKNMKKRKRKRLIVSILVIFLLLIGSGVAYATVLYQKFHNVANTAHTNLARGDKSDLRDVEVDPMNDNISILFIGVDKRKNEPSRSDAMILATFNHSSDSVKLVSIPRDSKVQIYPTTPKDYGVTKITHAHMYGDLNDDKGADYTIATVEHLFNIPVDYYVQVDFKAFTKIVNALDGVKVDVPVKLVTQDSKDKKNAIVLNPGKQTLNGEQALAFVRNRKSAGAGGDFGRGQRQMALIKAILHKSANISSITKYGDVIDSLNGHFQTNLTFSQMLGLHNYAGSLSNVDMLQLKGTDDMSTGRYYFDLDQNYLEQIKSELRDHLELNH
ncbi:LytR family transcriptional regulator [Terrilactibacillus sp. BCM23-1]|uniref:LytR family transcriptional regulator n=1 Tax=Terrilactibacillus tamarindi TaxID=2599694 RepID=A0A6N8CN66_9BACI|nr:LCP family protein [Terrilactibacillus tamarindi]MTT31549.1 LytR family transcriptional regulator [Terrilactibacillus tamarindi]